MVDEHNRTTVPGLYAAGGEVSGLDPVVVAVGHGAVAATDIHNRCERPTEEESMWPRKRPAPHDPCVERRARALDQRRLINVRRSAPPG